MDIFSIFTLCGGLAFFLYGMQLMSVGLEKTAGGRLERMLRKMTSNPFKSMALGAGITIAIQSSSALTVMLVGLVNSGIMNLGQTVGVIMGSNVGTTLTAWILSLSGIESSNFFLRLVKPESFSPIIALIGIIMMMGGKTTKKKSIGSIMVGFAILMFGMELMKNAMSPLADMPEFAGVLTAFTNPILGVLVGTIFTGVVQSSAASVGILQALSLTGGITYAMAIPIIMGQNIGTCVTAVISSIGVNTNARRVAAVHISFNIIGTIVFLILFYVGNQFLHFKFMETSINPVGIAFAHTVFNIATTIMLIPFVKQLEKIAVFLVKEKVEKEETVFLDERLLLSPSLAIDETKHMTDEMAIMAKSNLFASIDMLHEYAKDKVQDIENVESKLDLYEDKLGTFLVKLSRKELSDADSDEISKLLHTIGDFERIGDHASNLLHIAGRMNNQNVKFSDEANKELDVIIRAVSDILSTTTDMFINNDTVTATNIEPLEQVIDRLIAKVKARHIKRLQKGICTIELGLYLTDILYNFERVSDHCSNIAACVIQIKDSLMEKHGYLNEIKSAGHIEFSNAYDEYKKQYRLEKFEDTPNNAQ